MFCTQSFSLLSGFDSEYVEVDVIHPHFAHEPDTTIGPNGELVLYYIAANVSYPECECKDGSTPPNSCNQSLIDFTQFMQYSENGNVNGPWTKEIIFGRNNPLDDPNLAGVITENGTFIGLARDWENGYSSVYLVQSEDWKDGDKYKIDMNKQLFPQLNGGGTEDPFLYFDCDGNYHAIFNNQSPSWIISVCGGHAFSKDGINWIYTGAAFGNFVEFNDGTSFTFSRRERPHFVFDNDQCTPIALTNGATYTLLQPLKGN